MKASPAFSVYSATKAAVRSFARSWTIDLKDRKIRVNAISPGPIETPGFDGLTHSEEQRKQVKAGFVNAVPMGVWAARTKSPKPSSSSPPMTAATSRASSSSSTVVWRKSKWARNFR
jgi:NAD(P)-dependent dehydrogenase (short-subunit alcohol dehydrogenase family)